MKRDSEVLLTQEKCGCLLAASGTSTCLVVNSTFAARPPPSFSFISQVRRHQAAARPRATRGGPVTVGPRLAEGWLSSRQRAASGSWSGYSGCRLPRCCREAMQTAFSRRSKPSSPCSAAVCQSTHRVPGSLSQLYACYVLQLPCVGCATHGHASGACDLSRILFFGRVSMFTAYDRRALAACWS